jgi:CRP-like cAMP-binding protein
MQGRSGNHGRGNRLLAAVPGEELERLRPHMEEIRLESGAVLTDAQQPFTYVYFPHDSVVSLVSLMEDGRIAETATVGREGVAGFEMLLHGETAFNRQTVQLAGRASRIEFGRLLRVVPDLHDLRRVMYCYVQAFVAQVLQSVACNGLHSVDVRCGRWLLMTHDRVGKDSFPLTQEFLAEMLGVHRPTVTVAARMLQRAGLIRYSRGVVTILDRVGLESATCECYGIVRRRFERLLPLTFT